MAVQLVDSNTVDRPAAVADPLAGAALAAAASPENAVQEAADVPATPQDDYPVWRIPCGDMINRDRAITVFVEHGEVVVVGPPGETARLLGTQLNELRTALDEAAELAER